MSSIHNTDLSATGYVQYVGNELHNKHLGGTAITCYKNDRKTEWRRTIKYCVGYGTSWEQPCHSCENR